MSQFYYETQWKEAQNSLEKTINLDEKIINNSPYQDENTAKWLIGHLFMNYVQIVNKLDMCYDQIIHPQKREVISRLLDMALGRVLELKAEIIRIELDDYCFFDNILIELKLTHQDMEIHVPKYFWTEKETIKKNRRELIKKVFEEAEKEKFRQDYLKNIPKENKEEAWKQYLVRQEHERLEKEKLKEQQRKLLGEKEEMEKKKGLNRNLNKEEFQEIEKDILEAILLIQRHERARQGRRFAVLTKRNNFLKKHGGFSKFTESEEEQAAITIQRHWRRHRIRKKKKKKLNKILKIIGAIDSSFKDFAEVKKKEEYEIFRRKLKEQNQKEYEDAITTTYERVKILYSFPMKESIIDEIRSWFHSFFEKTNTFPDFPPDKAVIPSGEIMGIPKKIGKALISKSIPEVSTKKEKPRLRSKLEIALSGLLALQGSALVVAGHWITPEEFLTYQKELQKGNESKRLKKEKPTINNKANKEKKKLSEKNDAMNFQLKESHFILPIKKGIKDYKNTWLNLDESKNYDQRFIKSLLKDEKCHELALEIRKSTDKFMRLELDILKDALTKDNNQKKKKKKKKKKKNKKKIKSKTKKEKLDLTADRTIDDLFMELFRNGIIKEIQEVYLKDYMGERSYSAYDFRERGFDWPPSKGDIRELILQLCILPLGSVRIHQICPLIKSVCLIGPENSGKKFLTRIISTETSSIIFDLTSANLIGKYEGKTEVKMLQHLIEKMSRALQPSIIFVDGAEKTFYKKVPKEEKRFEPKKNGVVIKKLLKGIKPSDQILLLGVSSQPWLAKRKKFLKTYQKLILVPKMDYGSYLRLWQALLLPYHTIPRDFDFSCLAKVSNNFSIDAIMKTVKSVLNIERIGRSLIDPWKPLEFLQELQKHKTYDEKRTKKCIQFYLKTEMPRKKAKKLQQMQQIKDKTKKI